MTKPRDFITGGPYHVFGRGVDKRTIFLDKLDYYRFLECMLYFNQIDTTDSIYLKKRRDALFLKLTRQNPEVSGLLY
ncbi:MAG: hypothetical protein NUV82_02905, partial [Candidatus Komeilibacteria bacterium]|nr:hypothetical protein [Candidatus Komeilibacteria bacterium]